jgi:hypothetical protein
MGIFSKVRSYVNILVKRFRRVGLFFSIEKRFPQVTQEEREYIRALALKILRRSGGTVFYGPLAGLKIPENSYLATRPYWVIGCYEQELEHALSEVIVNPPSLIVDIGSAHGYYMVGLAVQTKDTKVIGFEAEPLGHWKEVEQLAQLNGVHDRITQKGVCTKDSLRECIVNDSLIISDCEGAELELLNPEEIPALQTCRIICEVHDFYSDKATAILVNRFRKTHRIELIHESARNPSQFRVLDGLSPIEKFLATRETKHIPGRLTAARFLIMKPKSYVQ